MGHFPRELVTKGPIRSGHPKDSQLRSVSNMAIFRQQPFLNTANSYTLMDVYRERKHDPRVIGSGGNVSGRYCLPIPQTQSFTLTDESSGLTLWAQTRTRQCELPGAIESAILAHELGGCSISVGTCDSHRERSKGTDLRRAA